MDEILKRKREESSEGNESFETKRKLLNEAQGSSSTPPVCDIVAHLMDKIRRNELGEISAISLHTLPSILPRMIPGAFPREESSRQERKKKECVGQNESELVAVRKSTLRKSKQDTLLESKGQEDKSTTNMSMMKYVQSISVGPENYKFFMTSEEYDPGVPRSEDIQLGRKKIESVLYAKLMGFDLSL